MTLRRAASLVVSSCLVVAAGCGGCGGGGDSKPRGRLVMNGQPLRLADGEEVSVSFSSADPNQSAASAKVAPDGSFVVIGPGLRPGDYSVSVIGSYGRGPDRYKDRFNGAFKGADSPLRCTVAPGASPSLVVDVGTKTVTAR